MKKVYITARSYSELRDAQEKGEVIEFHAWGEWVLPIVGMTWAFDGDGGLSSYRIVREEEEKVSSEKLTVPHKHAALIKAWAEGAKIQVLAPVGQNGDVGDGWLSCDQPRWQLGRKYRVKPNPPKPPKVDEYAELKAAHAAGKTIQVEGHVTWIDLPFPQWSRPVGDYRIKPELTTYLTHLSRHSAGIYVVNPGDGGPKANIKVTFEDGVLKGVQLI